MLRRWDVVDVTCDYGTVAVAGVRHPEHVRRRAGLDGGAVVGPHVGTRAEWSTAGVRVSQAQQRRNNHDKSQPHT